MLYNYSHTCCMWSFKKAAKPRPQEQYFQESRFHVQQGIPGKTGPREKGERYLLLKASFSGHCIMRTINTFFSVNICYPTLDTWGTSSLYVHTAAGSALCPELQCFISDYQLTRDAALHHGPEAWT